MGITYTGYKVIIKIIRRVLTWINLQNECKVKIGKGKNMLIQRGTNSMTKIDRT